MSDIKHGELAVPDRSNSYKYEMFIVRWFEGEFAKFAIHLADKESIPKDREAILTVGGITFEESFDKAMQMLNWHQDYWSKRV